MASHFCSSLPPSALGPFLPFGSSLLRCHQLPTRAAFTSTGCGLPDHLAIVRPVVQHGMLAPQPDKIPFANAQLNTGLRFCWSPAIPLSARFLLLLQSTFSVSDLQYQVDASLVRSPLGGSRFQGCHGYLPFSLWLLLPANLSSTSSQAHLFVMSLHVAKYDLGKVRLKPMQSAVSSFTEDDLKRGQYF